MDEEGVYYATRDMAEVFLYRFHISGQSKRIMPIPRLSGSSKLDQASVCFYGQQAGAFLSLIKNRRLIDYGKRIVDSNQKPKLRIYNFAGNPMMMRMIYANTPVNVVLDTHGQSPHDVAAGAFIACKAGATLIGIKEEGIDLESSLLHPSDERFKLHYILASDRALASELRLLFLEEPPPAG